MRESKRATRSSLLSIAPPLVDIITHAMIGGILASPFYSTLPLLAGGFVLGSVLPDMGALSRVFGKTAFLRCHQALSHSLLAVITVGGFGW